MSEKIFLSSAAVEIAEGQNCRYATFMISVLDEYDLNGRMIPKESGELYHSTMIGFPILAKMVCDKNGEPVDFAGHEMYFVEENGETQVRFDTEAVGSVIETWIEDREVAGYEGTKSCIMIKAKLWSDRYPEYFKVLDKLWSKNNVKTSWELAVSEVINTVQGRILKTFSFLGNTLLGSNVLGAVPGAGLYEYAEADPEIELAMALSRDMAGQKFSRKEDEGLNTVEETTVLETLVSTETQEDTEPAVVEAPVEGVETEESIVSAEESTVEEQNGSADPAPETDGDAPEETDEEHVSEVEESEVIEEPVVEETASLTDRDIRRGISEAYYKEFEQWTDVFYVFPEEHQAWLRVYPNESELDYIVVTYAVEGDKVTVSNPTPAKLTVAVSEVNKTIEDLRSAVASAAAEIAGLKEEIATLMPYKEAADEAERQRVEAETAQKKANFKARMISSKLFTEEEIETSEALKGLIENLDETGLKSEIAERYMKSLETATAKVEVSEKKEVIRVDTTAADDASFIRAYIYRD